MSFILFRDMGCARPSSNSQTSLALGTCLNVPVGTGSVSLVSLPGCPNSGTPMLLISEGTGCPSPTVSTPATGTSNGAGTGTGTGSETGSVTGAGEPAGGWNVVESTGGCYHLQTNDNIGSLEWACPALAGPAPTATTSSGENPQGLSLTGLVIITAYLLTNIMVFGPSE